MRGWKVILVLALAGCGVNQGWNPNYQFGNSPYGEYRAAREAALVTDADPSRVIPVARPFYAPTGADIAGKDPVPVPATMGVRKLRVVKPVASAGDEPVDIAPRMRAEQAP
ncbi:hypothetical protein Q4511_01525 [Paracoccus sp. 1_MG-2023]|uniref:hypothetical protein n=1 Tax=unclassified Paracoccus (in: a-proteobacteria) TaxID=2688777 RepID=UPI001C082205|nr:MULTISPECIES: hypothetical protein [unclassified Paracoccus (in: a-proteobacteria)]MBU2958600.1 hypothetical protein [Paracoccus sp. C2R09]MDO6667593.1 hypothetical protein [Paracoccus sp. 1_MG-2023]